jgi:hypothetical protein
LLFLPVFVRPFKELTKNRWRVLSWELAAVEAMCVACCLHAAAEFVLLAVLAYAVIAHHQP